MPDDLSEGHNMFWTGRCFVREEFPIPTDERGRGKGCHALELRTWDSAASLLETPWKPVAVKEATLY